MCVSSICRTFICHYQSGEGGWLFVKTGSGCTTARSGSRPRGVLRWHVSAEIVEIWNLDLLPGRIRSRAKWDEGCTGWTSCRCYRCHRVTGEGQRSSVLQLGHNANRWTVQEGGKEPVMALICTKLSRCSITLALFRRNFADISIHRSVRKQQRLVRRTNKSRRYELTSCSIISALPAKNQLTKWQPGFAHWFSFAKGVGPLITYILPLHKFAFLALLISLDFGTHFGTHRHTHARMHTLSKHFT